MLTITAPMRFLRYTNRTYIIYCNLKPLRERCMTSYIHN
jgi:hypothetical protein